MNAFYDLPERDFPLKFEAINESGIVVWTETVEGPAAIRVPPLRRLYGPVSIRITSGQGEVFEARLPEDG